ncbi:MAG: MmcQ/YjbR family DNA-binding protein [Bacteroidia bacterium]|nr:MmcQ/YjbR family DNA-binding protein [Bacteroidia bacterium]
MKDLSKLKTLALSFPEATEEPHFDKASFRVRKKIFLTIDAKKNTACIKLTPEDQSAFMGFDITVIYPSNGSWGKMGWTNINLEKVTESVLWDAVETSYRTVAPKYLSALINNKNK